MRWLKIIDLATDSQPIANEDGTVIVVFNGKIYNFNQISGFMGSFKAIFNN